MTGLQWNTSMNMQWNASMNMQWNASMNMQWNASMNMQWNASISEQNWAEKHINTFLSWNLIHMKCVKSKCSVTLNSMHCVVIRTKASAPSHFTVCTVL